MKILVLNGSPRPNGATSAMAEAFAQGARQAGHEVDVIAVCQKKIAGCLACEYCHTKGGGKCVQQDDMQQIYPLLDQAEMLVLASPIYYHNISGQLKCVVDRIYALDKPKNLKKIAMILSSGSPEMYEGAKFSYEGDFLDYLKLEGMGIFTSFGKQNKSPEKLEELRAFGASLQ